VTLYVMLTNFCRLYSSKARTSILEQPEDQ
jgi:hypothetical protein